MKIDKMLNDIQIKLIELANEIQKQRNLRLKATGTKKEKKDRMIMETSLKLQEAFKELGYDVP